MDQGEVDFFRKEGINAKWLQQGIDPIDNNRIGPREYEHDVSFLGNVNEFHEINCNRITLMAGLQKEFDINIMKSVRRQKASKVYYNTKVNIGNNLKFSCTKRCSSVRDFKIMGACGFLLTSYVEGIEDYFTPGVDLDIYHNTKECIEKVKFYLKHKNLREKIAGTGYKKVHKLHKYSDRVKIIIDDYWKGKKK